MLIIISNGTVMVIINKQFQPIVDNMLIKLKISLCAP